MENGRYEEQIEIIHHDKIIGQEEISHYEVIKEYDNGGKDIIKVIDQPYIEEKDAYDEEIIKTIFVPYTNEEIEINEINNRINELKELLQQSDYKAIKYLEGYYTDEEYEPIKQERQSYRDEINLLERRLK